MLLQQLQEDIQRQSLTSELEDERDGTVEEAGLLAKYVGDNGQRVLKPSVVGGGFKGEGDLRSTTAARNKSNAIRAREIAVARAKEKVQHLYADSPELDLVDFLIRHDKLSDAEAVLTAFTMEQGKMLKDDDPAYLRSYSTWARLKLAMKLFVDAIGYYRKSLALITVCRGVFMWGAPPSALSLL